MADPTDQDLATAFVAVFGQGQAATEQQVTQVWDMLKTHLPEAVAATIVERGGEWRVCSRGALADGKPCSCYPDWSLTDWKAKAEAMEDQS